jgi:hypothetical protein
VISIRLSRFTRPSLNAPELRRQQMLIEKVKLYKAGTLSR